MRGEEAIAYVSLTEAIRSARKKDEEVKSE